MSYPCKVLSSFITLLGIVLTFPSSAQNPKIDSLSQAYKKSASDTQRVYNLNKLSYEYENIGNYPIADSLAREALKLGTKADYPRGIALAYSQIGSVSEDL